MMEVSLSPSLGQETNPDMYATIYKTWLMFTIYISEHVKAWGVKHILK